MAQRIGAFRRHQGAFRAVSGAVMIVLAVALTFNLSDIIQRDIPNYTQAVGNSLEKGAAAAPAGTSVSLQDCQVAAFSGGSGLERCGPAPAFSGIQEWLNTPGGQPVSLASLRGKVVLVDFWAYSCINCQRELPHVEAWAKDYAADGLVVVGVHTPEYAFEHVPSNVEAGVRRLGLTPNDPEQTPETYLGEDRQQTYAGRTAYATGQFTPPATLPPNSFALAGAWTIGQEAITAGRNAGITLAFHASEVYLDVGGTGTLTVSGGGGPSKVIRVSGAPDIYTVATEQPARDGTLTIRLSPGLAAYSFTFG
jgi:thiol-disulfide isomerase/thioredoxin